MSSSQPSPQPVPESHSSSSPAAAQPSVLQPLSSTESGILIEDVLFGQLTEKLTKQGRSAQEIDLVSRAFEYGRKMHEGQKRKSGENYISHPVSVALILADMPVDAETIASAILHDTLEDTEATGPDLESLFGETVLHIVEGVTKLGKVKFSSAEDQQAENFRKMFLAMAEDMRVVMVKLCDRLHNMRTLDSMKPEKQHKIALETREIFAPLANRMGMGKIRAELEDLAFKYIEPSEYESIHTEIEDSREVREAAIQTVISKLKEQLELVGIKAKVYGRLKNHYSIYRKIAGQHKTLKDIFDISAVRVLVNEERQCYEVLGMVHHLFTPIPGRFKDYIAIPKSNLYQSLHTSVIGPSGRPFEVQIRTRDMHRIAEYGVAAHWNYKQAGESIVAEHNEDDLKLNFLRQMLEMKDETQDASDYVESVKLDLFRDQVFVFTPKGRVVDLPSGSTPVDFAYRIHTEVGNTCTGAVVNGKMVALNHRLKNGDIIEIVTNKKASPRLDWIKFVQTQNAKSRIRYWFKKNLKEEHELNGKRLLEEELTRAKFDAAMKSGDLEKVSEELNYGSLEDMFVALGYGEINLPRVINRLRKHQSVVSQEDALEKIRKWQGAKKNTKKSEIIGLEGMLYQMAKCCLPVPGEEILGVVTRSRGVMVHRVDCNNLSHVNPERMMELDWQGGDSEGTQRAIRLDIHVIDRVGVLKDILAKVADTSTNVSNVRVKLHSDNTANIELTVDVSDVDHIERLKSALRRLPDVMSVTRQQFRASRFNPGDNGE